MTDNDLTIVDLKGRINSLEILGRRYETALREAYQITHYGRGTMQDVDDVLERAIRGSAHNPGGNAK